MYHSPLILNSISISFGGRQLFKPFSASIAYGSRIGIIGRNGTGKSTLLRIISGCYNQQLVL